MKSSKSLHSVEYCNLATRPHLCTNVNKLYKSPSDETVHSASILDEELPYVSSFPYRTKKKKKEKQTKEDEVLLSDDRLIAQELAVWEPFREWQKKVKRKGAVPDTATFDAGGFEIKLPVSSYPSCEASSTALTRKRSSLEWKLWKYQDVRSAGYGTPQWDPICVKPRPDYRVCCFSSLGGVDTTSPSHPAITSRGIDKSNVYEPGYGPSQRKPLEWKPSASYLDREHPLSAEVDRSPLRDSYRSAGSVKSKASNASRPSSLSKESRPSFLSKEVVPSKESKPSLLSKEWKSIGSWSAGPSFRTEDGTTGLGQKSVQLWPEKKETESSEEDDSDTNEGESTTKQSSQSEKDETSSTRLSWKAIVGKKSLSEKATRTSDLLQSEKRGETAQSSLEGATFKEQLISISDLLIDVSLQTTDQGTLTDINMLTFPDKTQNISSAPATDELQAGLTQVSLSQLPLDVEPDEVRREAVIAVDEVVDALESRIMCGSECNSDVDTELSDSSAHSSRDVWGPEEKPPTFWEWNRAPRGRHTGYSSSDTISSDFDSELLALSDEECEITGNRLTSGTSLNEEVITKVTEQNQTVKRNMTRKTENTMDKELLRRSKGNELKAPHPSYASESKMRLAALEAASLIVQGEEPPVNDEDIAGVYTKTMNRLHLLAWNRDPDNPPLSAFRNRKTMRSSSMKAFGLGDRKLSAARKAEEKLFLMRDKAEKLMGPDKVAYIDIFQGDTNMILQTADGHLIIVDVEIAKQLNVFKYEIEKIGVSNFLQEVHRLPPLPLESYMMVLLWGSHFQAQEVPYESSSETSLGSEDSDVFNDPDDKELKSQESLASILSATSSDMKLVGRKTKKKKKKKPKKKKRSLTGREGSKKKIGESFIGEKETDFKNPRGLLEDDPSMKMDDELSVDGLVLLHAFLEGGEGTGGRMMNLLRAADALGAVTLRDGILRMVARSAEEQSAHNIKAMLNILTQESYIPHFLLEMKGGIRKRLAGNRGKSYAPPYMKEYSNVPRNVRRNVLLQQKINNEIDKLTTNDTASAGPRKRKAVFGTASNTKSKGLPDTGDETDRSSRKTKASGRKRSSQSKKSKP